MSSELGEPGKATYPSLGLGNSFPFKFEDQKGRVHRFNCNSESLIELISAINQRAGSDLAQENPQLLYEDDEGDKVLISTDADLADAVGHARIAGWKVLRLHLIYCSNGIMKKAAPASGLTSVQANDWVVLHAGLVLAGGAALIAGIGLSVLLLKRTRA